MAIALLVPLSFVMIFSCLITPFIWNTRKRKNAQILLNDTLYIGFRQILHDFLPKFLQISALWLFFFFTSTIMRCHSFIRKHFPIFFTKKDNKILFLYVVLHQGIVYQKFFFKFQFFFVELLIFIGTITKLNHSILRKCLF